MKTRHLLFAMLLGLPGTAAFGATNAPPSKPNVILILADDLGYGDLGCYGQKRIHTPNLDRLAAEGLRFTQAYAGTSVCAPSRCSLMTGRHTGHATVRGNQRPEAALSADEPTLATVFRTAGYTTGLIGKWGLGGADTPGAPNRKGFDYFFGYPSQTAAHDYYPASLLRNTNKVTLTKNENGRKGSYSHDLFLRDAIDFVFTNRANPFFLCLAVTIPHANNEAGTNGMQIPSDLHYSLEDWPQSEKNFASMITHLDGGVGILLELLDALDLKDKTVILFTSDNGPHAEGGHDPEFFNSRGGLRGIKRSVYEGGLRVPLIVRWPGRIKAGLVSDQVLAHWDFLPTFAALTGQSAPKNLDGVSMLPALLENQPVSRSPLYWEFHEGGFLRAVRKEHWKGVSLDPKKPLELYDLTGDPFEKTNVASEHSDVVREIEGIMEKEHVPDSLWPDS
jgi:arylsulfatase A-like enzyme